MQKVQKVLEDYAAAHRIKGKADRQVPQQGGDPSGVRGQCSSMKMLGSTVHPGAEADLRVILMA